MVFVLSTDRQPLDPCPEARARKLLAAGKAVEHRRFPYTIRLLHRTAAESDIHRHRLKLDPGSVITGISILQADQARVVWAAELTIAADRYGPHSWHGGRSTGAAVNATPATDRRGS